MSVQGKKRKQFLVDVIQEAWEQVPEATVTRGWNRSNLSSAWDRQMQEEALNALADGRISVNIDDDQVIPSAHRNVINVNLMEDDYIDLGGTADPEDYEFFNPSDEEDSDDGFAELTIEDMLPFLENMRLQPGGRPGTRSHSQKLLNPSNIP